jgi:hypothetical protein
MRVATWVHSGQAELWSVDSTETVNPSSSALIETTSSPEPSESKDESSNVLAPSISRNRFCKENEGTLEQRLANHIPHHKVVRAVFPVNWNEYQALCCHVCEATACVIVDVPLLWGWGKRVDNMVRTRRVAFTRWDNSVQKG